MVRAPPPLCALLLLSLGACSTTRVGVPLSIEQLRPEMTVRVWAPSRGLAGETAELANLTPLGLVVRMEGEQEPVEIALGHVSRLVVTQRSSHALGGTLIGGALGAGSTVFLMTHWSQQSFTESLPFLLGPAALGFGLGSINTTTTIQEVVLPRRRGP